MSNEGSTLDGLPQSSEQGAVWLRRLALGTLTAVVVADLVGLLGVHTTEVTAERNDYELTLRYPAVARAGLDTRWQVTVTHPGGFGKTITLAVTGSYFDMFETQGFHPEPSESTRDGTTLYLTFDPPDSDTFVVDFDAYIQPSSQQGRQARIAVVQGRTPVVWLDYHTWLLP